jgi:hypothetical protein
MVREFDKLVKIDDSTGCHLWQGECKESGYGKFKMMGKSISAHRFAYERAYGPKPKGKETIDHLCRVRNCCNPSHLEAVSWDENQRRALENIERETQQPQGFADISSETVDLPRDFPHYKSTS